MPLVGSNLNKRYNAINPWMSKALLVSRRTKERLYVKRCQKGDTGQYNEYDKVYCKAVRAAKTAYYAEQFKANASNWLVRECQGKSQVIDTIPSTFNCEGQQVSGTLDIANGFNKFLPGLVLNLPGLLMTWMQYPPPCHSAEDFTFCIVMGGMVLKFLSKMQS